MKKVTCIIVVLILLAGILSGCGSKKGTLSKNQFDKINLTDAGNNDTSIYVSVDVGDVYTFGSYEQDNDMTNGKEAIEWIVLAKESNQALLISRYALDCKNIMKLGSA